MREYLKFPEENYVGKKLSKERYIKSANLTNAEEKCLDAYLDSIEILYSFPFDDGEIIVLLVDYSSVECNKFSLNNFVMAVAQSLPYYILLIVRCEGVIRFFSFDEKENTVDARRSRVFSVNSSSDIIPLEDDYDDNTIILSLRDAAIMSKSAEQLYSKWRSSLSFEFDSSNKIVMDTFSYSLEKYHELAKKKEVFEKLTDDNFNDYEETDCLLYDGFPLEIDDVIDHRFFVEFCAYYARILFEELSDFDSLTENEWLKLYLDRCNSFAINMFNRTFDSRCVRIISQAYWYGNDDYQQAADCYDLDELKEHIGRYYFEEDLI